MPPQNLENVDFNLLRTLCILLDEGSVAAAAARLNLTASAVSHSLRRLRETFDDPLFIRVGQGLRPTESARQLGGIAAPLLERLVESIDEVSTHRNADLRHQVRTLRVVAPGALELTLVPELARILRQNAPGWRLHVIGFERRSYEADLLSQAVDMVLSVGGHTPKLEGLRFYDIWQDHLVCLVGPLHPFAGKAHLTRDDYLSCELVHPVPWPSSQHYLDVWLAREGLRRKLPVAVPSYAAVASLLLRTDLAAMMPDRTALALKQMHPALSICRIKPDMHSYLRLECRRESLNDPQLRWAIETIKAAAQSIDGLEGSPPS